MNVRPVQIHASVELPHVATGQPPSQPAGILSVSLLPTLCMGPFTPPTPHVYIMQQKTTIITTYYGVQNVTVGT